jgi:hypothetical protein
MPVLAKISNKLPDQTRPDKDSLTSQSTVLDRPLLSSKKSLHFETYKGSWNEQKYGYGSRRGPKLRITVLVETSSKLLLYSAQDNVVLAEEEAPFQDTEVVVERTKILS